MPFAIAFLIPYFRGRLFLAAIICGVAFLIHPITTIPLVCLLGLRLLIDGFRDDWRISAKAFGVFLICILPLLIRVFLIDRANTSDLSFFSHSDPQWLEIIRQRDSYIFLSVWRENAFVSTITYLVILLVTLFFRRFSKMGRNEVSSLTTNGLPGQRTGETDFWALGVIIVCVGLFIIGGVFVEWYPLPLVVQLQVLRSLYLIINLSMIYAAWLLWEGVRHSRRFISTPANQRISKTSSALDSKTSWLHLVYSLVGLVLDARIY